MLDPAIDQVQVFRLKGAAYERAAELSKEDGGVLTTPLLLELTLALADLFG